MVYEQDDSGHGIWSYDCRCGDQYLLTEAQVCLAPARELAFAADAVRPAQRDPRI